MAVSYLLWPVFLYVHSLKIIGRRESKYAAKIRKHSLTHSLDQSCLLNMKEGSVLNGDVHFIAVSTNTSRYEYLKWLKSVLKHELF